VEVGKEVPAMEPVHQKKTKSKVKAKDKAKSMAMVKKNPRTRVKAKAKAKAKAKLRAKAKEAEVPAVETVKSDLRMLLSLINIAVVILKTAPTLTVLLLTLSR
tara:strand:- start:145 stop:453 length:309 start_codon:yes stop_codon:yes gene_type:complete